MSSLRPDGAPVSRRRLMALAVLVLMVAALPSCSSNNVTLPSVYTALVQLTVDPNPIPGAQNTLTGAVTAAYKITLQELNGLGGEVQFVSSTVYDPATGQQIALNYFDGTDLTVFVGTKRLEPKGTLVVPQSLTYSLPNLSKVTTITVAIQVLDDRQNLITRSLLVPVQ